MQCRTPFSSLRPSCQGISTFWGGGYAALNCLSHAVFLEKHFSRMFHLLTSKRSINHCFRQHSGHGLCFYGTKRMAWVSRRNLILISICTPDNVVLIWNGELSDIAKELCTLLVVLFGLEWYYSVILRSELSSRKPWGLHFVLCNLIWAAGRGAVGQLIRKLIKSEVFKWVAWKLSAFMQHVLNALWAFPF